MSGLIVSCEPKIAHEAHLLGQIVVVRCYGTTLEGVEEFGGMKTEYLGVAKTANHPSVVRDTEGMCSIEKKA